MDDPNRFLPLSPHQFHILLSLTDGDRHGYALIQDIAERTDGALRMGTGTLYTAIARLVELGLIADAGRPPKADGSRPVKPKADGSRPFKKEHERRRYYRLLPLGRAVARAETARLEALVRHAHDMGVRPTVAPATGRRS
jgi:DNA-binding PadR family transcriptional regulator